MFNMTFFNIKAMKRKDDDVVLKTSNYSPDGVRDHVDSEYNFHFYLSLIFTDILLLPTHIETKIVN